MINQKVLNSPFLILRLKTDLVRTIKRGHVWIYQNALREHKTGFAGQRVKLFDKQGKNLIAEGYYDPESPIRVRICSLADEGTLNNSLLKNRLSKAISLRENLFNPEITNAYRMVNGPGDDLPGLVIDKYDHTAVIRLDGKGAQGFWDTKTIADLLIRSSNIMNVYHKYKAGGKSTGNFLAGNDSITEVEILENNLKFLVNFKAGQKTGFFLDQRDNRERIQPFVKDKSVLNMFGYTGGFSVYAGMAGVHDTTTVDLAQPALNLADRNWELNGLAPDNHRSVKADAFEYLESQRKSGKKWGLVILDPPSYVHSEKHFKQGINAYTKLIAAGASVTKDNGILCASSCSSHVDMQTFLDCCENGVSKARKRAAVLGIYRQPEDHPAPLVMPELRYLKFFILKIHS